MSKSVRWILRIFLVIVILLLFLPLLLPLPNVGVDAETLADSDGRFITVNDLETYVLEEGDPNGEVVLLLHGWGGSTYSWRDTLPALADAGYRAIAFDRPPYGLSAKTGDLPMSLIEQADFTVAFMDALNIERSTLIGHSMGGGVTAYFAQRYPNRVNKLVFVDGVNVGADEDRRESPSLLASALNFQPVQWWARVLMRAFVRPDAFAGFQRTAYYDPAVVTDEVIAGYGRQLQVEGWDAAMIRVLARNQAADTPLTADELRAINAPSLIVWGEQDTWVEIDAGERLRDLLPDVRWITYPNVGHLPMEEVPAQFNADVIAFLNE